MSVSCKCCVRCHVEVYATGRSQFTSSHAECGVSKCMCSLNIITGYHSGCRSILARSENCEEQLLASSHLSVRMEQISSRRTEYH